MNNFVSQVLFGQYYFIKGVEFLNLISISVNIKSEASLEAPSLCCHRSEVRQDAG